MDKNSPLTPKPRTSTQAVEATTFQAKLKWMVNATNFAAILLKFIPNQRRRNNKCQEETEQDQTARVHGLEEEKEDVQDKTQTQTTLVQTKG